MATNTAGTVAREYPQQMVHYLRKTLTFSDDAVETTIGWIPSGALILKALSGVAVTTAFNGSSPVIDIGADDGNDDPDEWGTDLDISATNFVPLDEAIGTYVMTADTQITATIAGGSSSAGVLEVVICYIPDNDG